ncbi:MAG: preprotein translocase subunit SecE [bacterium]
MEIVEPIKSYFVGSYRELKKVSWPTKKQTINYSVLVIAMSIGMALFFSILDYIFEIGFKMII